MASIATFERLKDRGMAAYKQGDWAKAEPFLIQAAGQMIQITKGVPAGKKREQYESIARQYVDLSKECKENQNNKASRRGEKEGDDKGTNANDWVVKEKPNISFDDIAGLEDVKEEIRMKMLYPFNFPELAKKFGIQLGGGVLLYGPPGTGKTMIAKAIAKEIDATFYVISPAQIMSKWVGEAEQNIKKLFDAAKKDPKAVIFIDEIEALVPKRKASGSTVMARLVPQILQELEGFDRKGDRCLLFCGATNKPWMLDEAMRRPGRLDSCIYVPLPDAPARFKLLELNLENRPVADDVDFGKLCDKLEGYSGADIRNIASKASQIPFREAVSNGGESDRQINMSDLLFVIEEQLPSVNTTDLNRFEKFEETGQ